MRWHGCIYKDERKYDACESCDFRKGCRAVKHEPDMLEFYKTLSKTTCVDIYVDGGLYRCKHDNNVGCPHNCIKLKPKEETTGWRRKLEN